MTLNERKKREQETQKKKKERKEKRTESEEGNDSLTYDVKTIWLNNCDSCTLNLFSLPSGDISFAVQRPVVIYFTLESVLFGTIVYIACFRHLC